MASIKWMLWQPWRLSVPHNLSFLSLSYGSTGKISWYVFAVKAISPTISNWPMRLSISKVINIRLTSKKMKRERRSERKLLRRQRKWLRSKADLFSSATSLLKMNKIKMSILKRKKNQRGPARKEPRLRTPTNQLCRRRAERERARTTSSTEPDQTDQSTYWLVSIESN